VNITANRANELLHNLFLLDFCFDLFSDLICFLICFTVIPVFASGLSCCSL